MVTPAVGSEHHRDFGLRLGQHDVSEYCGAGFSSSTQRPGSISAHELCTARRRITADMLIGLLDAAVESLARRPLLAEEDDWAQQELLPPILPVSCFVTAPGGTVVVMGQCGRVTTCSNT